MVDRGLARFHGHGVSPHRGSTYNAFLVVDGKAALVDTVWGTLQGQLIAAADEVVDPAKMDFVASTTPRWIMPEACQR